MKNKKLSILFLSLGLLAASTACFGSISPQEEAFVRQAGEYYSRYICSYERAYAAQAREDLESLDQINQKITADKQATHGKFNCDLEFNKYSVCANLNHDSAQLDDLCKHYSGELTDQAREEADATIKAIDTARANNWSCQ